jgi:hypothetical protein
LAGDQLGSFFHVDVESELHHSVGRHVVVILEIQALIYNALFLRYFLRLVYWFPFLFISFYISSFMKKKKRKKKKLLYLLPLGIVMNFVILPPNYQKLKPHSMLDLIPLEYFLTPNGMKKNYQNTTS